jgi:hypothetical protein
MQSAALCVAIVFLIAGVAGGQQPSESDAALDRHFDRYCDYTGGLGIGFVPSHTYDYQFRQRLKKSEDRELKRLFVLQHLYRDVELAVSDFEEGVIHIGKGERRAMTAEERVSVGKQILEKLDDLTLLDPKGRDIAKFKRRVSGAGGNSER